MRFETGNTAGPGRPKGSLGGRARALLLLDDLLAEEGNVEKLRVAMQASFDQNPMRFFRNVIMPLLPRDVMLKLGEEGAIKWVSLLTTFPTEPSDSSTTIEAAGSAPSVADGAGARPALPPPNS